MTAEDLRHFRAIGRTASGSVDYFGSLAEVRGPHDRRGYDGELFDILVTKIVEAVHRTSRDAQRLTGMPSGRVTVRTLCLLLTRAS